MAILSFLLPIFFIFLGFGEIFKIKFQLAAATGLIDFILVLIVIVWLLFIKKGKYKLKLPILIFLASATFSLLINFFDYSSNQLVISSMYLIRFVFYISLYFVFVDIGKNFKNVIPKYMFATGLIFLIFGIYQYFLFSNLKTFFYLGWDEHINRLFSTFFDPNFAGAFLVLILIFTYVLKDKIFPKDWKLVPSIFLIFNFIAIILTYSRGAYLMLFVSIVIYSLITKKWKIMAGVIATFMIVFIIFFPKYNLESTNLLRTTSIESRISSMTEAVYIFEKKPMGVGFNTYRYAREKYGYENIKGLKISNAGAGVDNSLIFVLVTTGLIGFIAYSYLLYKIFELGILNLRKNQYALVLTVSLVGLMVNALVINSLFYSYLMLWIFILVGFTESSLHE